MKKTKTIEKGTSLLQEFIEWLIYVAGYTLVFIIVTKWTPEEVSKVKESYTGEYLKNYL